MNIVFLFSDEHAGAVMGNSGHPVVQTPHLDRLAEQSYTFDNAYCNYPICTPSRLSMLTGRYPHQIGAWDLGVIPDRQYPTWGDYLAAADYETVLCGRTHFNGTDRLHGFSHRLLDDLPRWCNRNGRPPRRTADARRGSNSHVAECGPGTTNTHGMTETSRTWQWISFAKKPRHRTTNRSYSIVDSCTRTFH